MIFSFSLISGAKVFGEDDIQQSNQSILITKSEVMDKVVFDGKWTFFNEWKRSSWDKLLYEDKTTIHLRTAHQGDFIYVFVDTVDDFTLDKGMDKATICFDVENNKNIIPDKNDFCFSVALGHNSGSTFQGGSLLELKGNFKKISNPDGFIASSSVSDENDRYTKVPHPSYEFRIPTSLVERNDVYGFYLSVYDHTSKKFYTWPTNSHREGFFEISSPSEWGDLVSPDKSLPEFHWSLLTLFSALLALTLFSKCKKMLSVSNDF